MSTSTTIDDDLPNAPATCPPTAIPFTQYLMPHGKTAEVWTTRPPEIVALARAIIERGYRFECEMLPDYQSISLTIVDDEDDQAMEVAPNGPPVNDALDRMVRQFAERIGIVQPPAPEPLS